MSTKINLQIRRQPDIDLLDYGVIDTRVLCYVSFQPSNKEDNELMPAIIDTGAPMSLIPKFIWSKCFTKTIQEEAYLSGIIPGAAHILKTKIGIISAELFDKIGNHYYVSFCTHLVPINKVPIIVGIQDILEKAVVHIDLKGNSNWLEFR